MRSLLLQILDFFLDTFNPRLNMFLLKAAGEVSLVRLLDEPGTFDLCL